MHRIRKNNSITKTANINNRYCVSDRPSNRSNEKAVETDQAVYPQQNEVDTDDNRLVHVDYGSCHRVVVAEQIRQQPFFVRCVAEPVLGCSTISFTNYCII